MTPEIYALKKQKGRPYADEATLSGAIYQIRTDDLILTKDVLCLLS